jgi:hypothetical protein
MLDNLQKCHDCGVEPGYTHRPGCDTERCSHCSGQVLVCGGCPDDKGKMRHDPCFARWTGIHPGLAEARELGVFTKWTDHGWEKCSANDPEARPDLNTFYAMGYHRIFFIKPTVENGKDITNGE